MGRLKNKSILITQSADYMGPAIEQLFRAEGAKVTSLPGIVPIGAEFDTYLQDLSDFDVVIANLAHPPCNGPIEDLQDTDWTAMFDTMVQPLMGLTRAFAPRMARRGYGKIIAITSAAPLKGLPGSAAYCAARGAQNAWIKAAGLEYAARNVQINAIAQNYVSNPVYYPDDLVASERFQKHLIRNVPIQRVARPEEQAEFALFLASDNSDFFVGQVFPFSGGWAVNA
jgi:2-keto-3-deoxy-L-fuconate dehydrogenase